MAGDRHVGLVRLGQRQQVIEHAAGDPRPARDLAPVRIGIRLGEPVALVVGIGPRCFLTPGHLRRPAPAGSPPTFALVEAGAVLVEMTVFSEEAAELRKERVTLTRPTTKLSVR